jgi:hypothetical protein
MPVMDVLVLLVVEERAALLVQPSLEFLKEMREQVVTVVNHSLKVAVAEQEQQPAVVTEVLV